MKGYPSWGGFLHTGTALRSVTVNGLPSDNSDPSHTQLAGLHCQMSPITPHLCFSLHLTHQHITASMPHTIYLIERDKLSINANQISSLRQLME